MPGVVGSVEVAESLESELKIGPEIVAVDFMNTCRIEKILSGLFCQTVCHCAAVSSNCTVRKSVGGAGDSPRSPAILGKS